MNVENRTLFIADNLDIMRGIDSETIDLIYLDPPFNTKKQYKAPIGSPAEGATFKDIWTDEDVKDEWHGEIAERHEALYQIIQSAEVAYDRSMKIYLMAMAIRLFEMQRILKPTGSIYLHCDPTASHYLKLVMDGLFGKQNFRNEIVWHYPASPSTTRQDFPRKHDIMLRYTMGDFIFNADEVRIPYSEASLKRAKYPANKSTVLEGTKINLNKRGKLPPSVWTDIPQSYRLRKEYTGYPTQKPLALLQRIIKASSNEGDMVLDPFCGCASACVAAEQLGRQWIGIDISPSAEVITKLRLEEASEQGLLFSPIQMSDVIVTCDSPVRTDPPDPPSQLRFQDLFAPLHPNEYSQERLQAFLTDKQRMYGSQEGKCNGCQHPFPFRNMTIDHIIPQSQEGSDDPENLQLLCGACNSTKGDRPQEYLINKLREDGILRS